MDKNIDLEYLCSNLGNLSAMPVRLYQRNEQLFYYSIISLPVDPVVPYLDKVFSVENHVGYFLAPHDYIYGVCNFEDKHLIVGPTRQVPITKQELKEVAFESNVQIADIDDFINGMKNILSMPLTSLLQMLTQMNHVLNNGEKLSLTDLAIYDYEQEKMVEHLAREDVVRTIENNDEIEQYYGHNTMDVENFILTAVRKGNVPELKKYFDNIPAVRIGIMANNDLRQEKNLLIVTATLVSRESIRGGMDADEALALSDSYIKKCEMLNSTVAVTNLTYRMIIDYAERMEHLNLGDKQSKLAVDVINYIRHHLSEPIKVEELAHFLCCGRSRLSTDFKKETGETLSEFILKQKIEEAKHLLRYTNKPAVNIAFFLGFSSQSHFSRTFKKYVQMTPFEYRASRNNI